MSKRVMLIILSILILTLIVSCTQQPTGKNNGHPDVGGNDMTGNDDVIKLKMVSSMAKNSPVVWYVPEFIKRVEEATEGRVKIDWLGGPEVIPETDQGQSLMRGTVDVAALPFPYYANILPEADLYEATQFTPMEERENGIFEMIAKDHEKINMVYLGKLSSGRGYYLYPNKKITKLEDFKGLKLRASAAQVPLIRALGAVPVMQSMSEAYNSVQKGVVDGLGGVPSTVKSFSMEEIVKYFVDHSFYDVCHPVQFNVNVWNRIPEDLQNIIKEVVIEFEPMGREYEINDEKTVNKYFEENGMEPIRFDKETADEYRRLAHEAKINEIEGRIPDESLEAYKKKLLK